MPPNAVEACLREGAYMLIDAPKLKLGKFEERLLYGRVCPLSIISGVMCSSPSLAGFIIIWKRELHLGCLPDSDTS